MQEASDDYVNGGLQKTTDGEPSKFAKIFDKIQKPLNTFPRLVGTKMDSIGTQMIGIGSQAFIALSLAKLMKKARMHLIDKQRLDFRINTRKIYLKNINRQKEKLTEIKEILKHKPDEMSEQIRGLNKFFIESMNFE